MERLAADVIECSDVLHPNRPNVSKDELRGKLSELYKSDKDQVSVFGFRTQYGGGKSTGFALIYDSAEAMKKFEPHYRLVRYGQAQKIEKASRQQRTSLLHLHGGTLSILRYIPLSLERNTDMRCVGKQRKNRSKEFRGTQKNATAKKAKKDK